MNKIMDKSVPQALRIYDRRAGSYDKSWNSMMDTFIAKWRKIYSQIEGKVLEVGSGTGNNLPFYNSKSKVTASDWSPHMVEKAQSKVNRLKLKNIERVIVADIEKLSDYFEPHSFDYVTSTCVFCSVPHPVKGLQEVAKVLHPSGKLIQIEHGISNNVILNLGLKLLDPLSSRMQGLHVTRNIAQLLRRSGFTIDKVYSLDRFGIFHLIVSHPTH